MRRQLAIALGLSLALPLLALRGWISLQCADAAPPDDGDLRPPPAAIADAENGSALFAAAAEAAVLPHGEESWDRLHAFRGGVPADEEASLAQRAEGERSPEEWIGALAAQNGPALALLRAGVASPRLHYTLDSDPARALVRIHPLVAIAGAQARLLAQSGDPAAAIELASLGLRSAQRIGGADNVGLAVVALASNLAAMSLADLDGVVRSTPMTPELAHEVSALLEKTRWTTSAWSAVWAHEYARAQRGFAAVPAAVRGDAARATGLPRWAMLWIPFDYLWQPNRTRAALADLYRDQQHKSALFCAQAKLVPPRQARPALAPRPARLFAPNLVGELIVELAPRFDDTQRRRCHIESAISLVQALAAVKAHWDAQGALPERLDDLVPAYLDALPLDRFDGQPIRYSRSAAVVSSIGDDLVAAAPAAHAPAPRLSDAPEPALSLSF